jgi:hypothetical protein
MSLGRHDSSRRSGWRGGRRPHPSAPDRLAVDSAALTHSGDPEGAQASRNASVRARHALKLKGGVPERSRRPNTCPHGSRPPPIVSRQRRSLWHRPIPRRTAGQTAPPRDIVAIQRHPTTSLAPLPRARIGEGSGILADDCPCRNFAGTRCPPSGAPARDRRVGGWDGGGMDVGLSGGGVKRGTGVRRGDAESVRPDRLRARHHRRGDGPPDGVSQAGDAAGQRGRGGMKAADRRSGRRSFRAVSTTQPAGRLRCRRALPGLRPDAAALDP